MHLKNYYFIKSNIYVAAQDVRIPWKFSSWLFGTTEIHCSVPKNVCPDHASPISLLFLLGTCNTEGESNSSTNCKPFGLRKALFLASWNILYYFTQRCKRFLVAHRSILHMAIFHPSIFSNDDCTRMGQITIVYLTDSLFHTCHIGCNGIRNLNDTFFPMKCVWKLGHSITLSVLTTRKSILLSFYMIRFERFYCWSV